MPLSFTTSFLKEKLLFLKLPACGPPILVPRPASIVGIRSSFCFRVADGDLCVNSRVAAAAVWNIAGPNARMTTQGT